MCRLLFVRSENDFEIGDHLALFAEIAESSKEYQGHGWGCSYLRDGEWQVYKNIQPIWEDSLTQFGTTRRLMAHARSAFKNEGIRIENNMPFFDPPYVFIFNGELHGVRIKETGRTGAEKIFNYVKRFLRKGPNQALAKATEIIRRRTRFVRAMNIILADHRNAFVASTFNDDPDYFTMYCKQTSGDLIICSEKYPNEDGWQAIPNETMTAYS